MNKRGIEADGTGGRGEEEKEENEGEKKSPMTMNSALPCEGYIGTA